MLKQKASARINRRYLLINGKKEAIEKAVLDYVGILGWAKASPLFLKKIGGKQILSISRKEVNDIKAAFVISSENLEVLKVSGTIKGLTKCRKKLK